MTETDASSFRDHENFHEVEIGAISGMDRLHFKLFKILVLKSFGTLFISHETIKESPNYISAQTVGELCYHHLLNNLLLPLLI